MEFRLLKLQIIYHNYSSKTLLIKIFFLATLMALIPCFNFVYQIDGCDYSWTFQKVNLRMNVSELHSAFRELIEGDWLKQRYKSLSVGRESVRAVMVMRKLGFRDAIGVNRKPCSSFVMRGDIYELPFKENSFDFVFSTAMIEGIRIPAKMVLEIERVLRPGRVGVVLRRVLGHVPTRDVMKTAAPVASYLKFSKIVGIRMVNRTVMVIFKKKFIEIGEGGDLGILTKRDGISSSPLPRATQ